MNVRKHPAKHICVIAGFAYVWDIISRNERSVTVAGRHFFASRCSLAPSPAWRIDELSGPLSQRPTTKIKGFATAAMTRGLSAALDAALELSDDAKMLAGQMFGLGLTAMNFEMIVGKPSARCQAALDEMVAAGMITCTPLNMVGGVSYKPVAGVDFQPLAKWAIEHRNDGSFSFPITEPIKKAEVGTNG